MSPGGGRQPCLCRCDRSCPRSCFYSALLEASPSLLHQPLPKERGQRWGQSEQRAALSCEEGTETCGTTGAEPNRAVPCRVPTPCPSCPLCAAPLLPTPSPVGGPAVRQRCLQGGGGGGGQRDPCCVSLRGAPGPAPQCGPCSASALGVPANVCSGARLSPAGGRGQAGAHISRACHHPAPPALELCPQLLGSGPQTPSPPPPNPSRRGWRCRWPRFQEHERGTRSRFSVILGTINQAGDRCGAAAAAAAGVSDGSRAAAWATCGSGVRAVPGSGVPAVPGSGCPQLWSPGCPCLWHPGCRWLRCPSCPQFHRPGCPRLRHPGSGAPPAVSGSIAPLSQLQCTLFSPAPVFIQPKCPSCPQLRHLRCPSPGCHQLRSPALSQLWLSQLQCPLCSQLQPCASPLPRSSGCLQPQPSHSPSSSIPFSPVSSVPAVPSPVALSPVPNPRILINKDKGPTQRLSLYVQVYIQKMAKKRETQKNIYKGEGAEVEGAGATPHLRSPLCTGPGRRYLHQGIFTGERGHRTGDAPGKDGTGAAVWLCPGP